MERAIFGAGCFWGVEATFRQPSGVENVIVGYAGGTQEDPTYQDVCRGNSGHAEVIQLSFDPTIIRYDELLDVFWQCHDPTTLNRQEADFETNNVR